MRLIRLIPRKALNQAFLRVKPKKNEIEVFRANLIQLLDRAKSENSIKYL